ncbi:glutamine amidotransferase-related protein [Shewanella algidipiscicola]|uniref:glutamine amidotransferase-related protein n=1 Tax=Shewanella algidipiscicola TaxID=614070 RepID=UPI000D78488C|nr:glutamine amidotransferase [Shewanella algidipiscicola]
MHIHFIIHESYEGPAAFSQWVTDNGFKQTSTHLYLGESLPAVIDFDLLVILGGPQSPLTRRDECAYFDVEQEISLINRCIAKGKALVGVCLGAQLIGEALGAKFEHSPQREIGYFPITMTDAALASPLFEYFQLTEVVGHWHNDMPGLLPTSKVLAYSQACPRQIVEYGDLIYGFQCHLEFTQTSISALIASAFEQGAMFGEQWVQHPADMAATDTRAMNRLLFQFLDKLVLKYKAH